MKVISFQNQKGGVGKSTLSILLADQLSDHGKSVVFLDNDPQANSTRFFFRRMVSESKENGKYLDSLLSRIDKFNLGSLLEKTIANEFPDINDYLIEVPHTSIRFIPVNDSYADIARKIANDPGNSNIFRFVLQDIAADIMIIDSPGEISHITQWGMSVANTIVIPVTTEMFSSETVRVQLDRIKKEQTLNQNINLKESFVIPNKHNPNHVVNKKGMTFLTQTFKNILIFDGDEEEPLYIPDRQDVARYIDDGGRLRNNEIKEVLVKLMNHLV